MFWLRRAARLGHPQASFELAERVLNKRGKRIDKGFIYKLIKSRVYLGEAVHKGTSYPGEHNAIITRELWDSVHSILKESPRDRRAKNRNSSEALLKGIIFTDTGAAMTPTYTRKGERLYHYYTSMDLIRNRETGGAGPMRLAAAMVDGAVIATVAIYRAGESSKPWAPLTRANHGDNHRES